MKKSKFYLNLAFLMMFSSCSESKIIQDKIIYDTSSIEYSKATSSLAITNLNYLLNNLYGKLLSREDILDISNNIEAILRKSNINENDYINYFDYILNNTKSITDNYNGIDNNALSLLFDKTIETFGLENISTSLYEIICYYYDHQISNYKDNIKENPKLESMYQNYISEAKADKEIFKSIDKNTFNNLINGFVMCYLFINNNLTSDNELSNEEILLFVKQINVNINLNDNQWLVIFKNLKKFSNNIKAFAEQAINNNDYIKIGNSMNDLFNLLDNYIKNMDSFDIDIIKTKNYEDIIESVVNFLDANNKQLLIDMFDIELDSSYLDYLEGKIDLSVIEESTIHTTNDLFTCSKGNYLDTLYGIVKEVFYD